MLRYLFRPVYNLKRLNTINTEFSSQFQEEKNILSLCPRTTPNKSPRNEIIWEGFRLELPMLVQHCKSWFYNQMLREMENSIYQESFHHVNFRFSLKDKKLWRCESAPQRESECFFREEPAVVCSYSRVKEIITDGILHQQQYPISATGYKHSNQKCKNINSTFTIFKLI